MAPRYCSSCRRDCLDGEFTLEGGLWVHHPSGAASHVAAVDITVVGPGDIPDVIDLPEIPLAPADVAVELADVAADLAECDDEAQGAG